MLLSLLLAALVGPEADPTVPVTVRAPGAQRNPVAAWDGTQFLVAWEENRPDGAMSGVWAAMVPSVGASGTNFVISSEPALDPAVGCGSPGCLVAWNALSGLHAARVVSGAVLDAPPLVVDVAASAAPSVSCNGSTCLVVYDVAGALKGVRVNLLTGAVIDGTPLALGAGSTPAVGFDGTSWVMAFISGTEVIAARVSTAGVLGSSTSVLASATTKQQPKIACVAGQCLVSWESVGTSNTSLQLHRVSAAGLVEVSAVTVVTVANTTPIGAAVAADGANYVLSYVSSNVPDISQSAVSSTGGLSVSPAAVATSALETAIASSGSRVLVAWADFRASDADLYARRIGLDGTGGVLLATAANRQQAPGLAVFDGGYLVTWQDERSGAWDLWGARLDAQGRTLDSAGLQISNATNTQRDPAVACSGALCFVMWGDLRAGSVGEARSTRVTFAGTVVDPAGAIAVAGPTGLVDKVALAAGTTRFAAAWSAGTTFKLQQFDLATGAASGTTLTLGAADSWVSGGVAFANGTFLVVMSGFNGSTDDVVSARVAQAGAALDATPVIIGDGNTGHGGNVSRQPVASDGTNFLVTWVNGTNVEARLVGSNGQPSSAPFLVGAGAMPVVTFDGRDYVVGRIRSDGLYLVRVSTAGVLVTPEVVVPMAPYSFQADLRLASRGVGQVGAVFTRYDAAAQYGTRRVRAVVVSFDTDGGVPVDAGVPDAGGGGSDGGAMGSDGGATGSDGGATGADGGATGSDAGTTGSDGGATGADGGVTNSDGGAVSADGGTTGSDGGTTNSDGGVAEMDGGMTGADGGTESPDGGQVSAPRVYVVGCDCASTGSWPIELVAGALFIGARRRR